MLTEVTEIILVPVEGLKEGIWGSVAGVCIFSSEKCEGLGFSVYMDLLGRSYMCG